MGTTVWGALSDHPTDPHGGRRSRVLMATGVALALAVALLVGGPSAVGSADAAPLAAEPAHSDTQRPGAERPDPELVIKSGVKFNHPFRKHKRTAIQRQIIRAVKNAPKGATIRVMTWNFDSPILTRTMVKAHQRGVSVQIIIARGLARTQGPGRSFPNMQAAFKKSGNKKRDKAMRSWIRTCSATCRGKGGAMHNKMMLVSHSGASQFIVMQGSANFTGAASYNQFNDWTTVTENQALYEGWMKMWRQSKKDRSFPALRFRVGNIESMFAPHRNQIDPALKALKGVTCQGATNTEDGRTKIRVANAVWGDERGARIARRVRSLHNQGCDVKVVFMMLPMKIRNIFAGMPAKQMIYIQGAEANKFKDRYVHIKGLAVQGNIKGRTDGNLVLSSSENWTQLGWHSDEHNIIFHNDVDLTAKYTHWIDVIFREAPRTLANYVESSNEAIRIDPDTQFLGPKDYPFGDLEAELH